MTAQIRPNRMEVSDRFPMLGFSIRTDQPNVDAEVALATDVALFQPENQPRRTAANFYSSREGGTLAVPRGEGVFVVPPDVLARFIGSDRLFFGLASGKSGNGGLKTDAVPRDGSPYVSLRGFTGRTLRRGYSGARRTGSPRFDWAGDDARPGSEPTGPSTSNGTSGSKPANGVAPVPYDDGFGPLPEATTRPSAPPPVTSQSLAVVRALSDEPVLATPPSVTTLGAFARSALKVAIMAAPPPFGPLFATLISAANALGCSVGFGPQVGGGLGAGGQLGVGVIFGKDGDLGVYGSTEIDIGFITSISATANITVVQGGIDAFNGWNYALAISGGEGVVGGGAILLDTESNFVGVSGNIGIGAGFSPVDFYVAAQRSWSTRVMALAQARAQGFASPMQTSRFAYGRPMSGGWTPRQVLDWIMAKVQQGIAMAASTTSPPSVYTLASGDAETFLTIWERAYIVLPEYMRLLPRLARDSGVTLSIGPALDTPLFSAGVGVVFAPDGSVGLFGVGDISISASSVGEIMSSLKATLQGKLKLGYNEGGIAKFESIRKSAGLSEGAEIVVGAEIWLDGNDTVIGGAASIGLGYSIQFAAEDAIGSVVMPQLPGDQRSRAARIGGEFAPRIGQAIDLGLKPESLDPLLNLLDPPATPQPLSHTKANGVGRALNAAPWSINWDGVDVVGQPTDNGCWATTIAMLLGWRDQMSIMPASIAQQCGRDIANGLPWSERANAAATLGLGALPPQCYLPEGFASLIENHGPLYVGKMASATALTGHAVLVVGMYFDGANHFLRIADPWDRPVGTPGAPGNYAPTHHSGSRYIMRYEDFQNEYEMAAAGNPAYVQILYGGVPEGRSINRGQPPAGYAMSAQSPANGVEDLLPAPAPRARAMTGGAVEAAIAIGGIAIESIRDNVGDITWDLDQFRGIKHPNDSAPANPGAFQDGATIKLDDWPSTGPIIDSINAWFSIDWQYNGKSLGNVRINNIGTNDAIGASLSVRAQIMDDNRLYAPNNCAALRVTLHYRFSRPLGSDHIAIREIHLYGDGTWESDGRWIQSDVFGLVPPPAEAMTFKGDVAVELVGVIAGQLISSSDTDISYALDRFENWKRPQGMAADAPMGTIRRSTKTVEWDDGGWLDELGMKVDIEWQHDGTSLGHVNMTPYGFNDARGDSLVVTGKILNDFEPYYGMMTISTPEEIAAYRTQPGARLRVQLHYRKSRYVRSDQVYVIEVTLLPDGRSYSEGKWKDNDIF